MRFSGPATGVETNASSAAADRRLLLTAALVFALAASFWTSSRYPDLNRKAAVGGDMAVTGLAFDVVVQTTPQESWWRQVAAATVNWVDTNKRGMTFGLLMAGAFLTLLNLLARRSVSHPLGNSLLGVAIGAPMGLCVNCATPIATAMHRGGTRLETSLAMLVSSPTLNVIVLAMLIALFPWYIWLTKIVATTVLALLVIPLLCRWLFRREAAAQQADPAAAPGSPADPSLHTEWLGTSLAEVRGWRGGALWLLRTYAGHLWWLVRTAVPLMLLAGLLGSIVITLAPWEMLEHVDPVGPLATVAFMCGLAVVAAFLPVPMAFDVVICAILFERGLPAPFLMVLLVALGTYSVYPFLMLRKAVSLRVAAVLFAATCGIAVASGVAVYFLEPWHAEAQKALISQMLLGEAPAPAPPLPDTPAPIDEEGLAAALVPQGPRAIVPTPQDSGVRIERYAFRASAGTGVAPFSRHDGATFGIEAPTVFSPRRLQAKLAGVNRPIASGDVHGDGWPDLLIGADQEIGGVLLFANVGGTRFVRQRVELGALQQAMVQTAALVDLDGDGWLDIFFSTFAEGNFAIPNRQGRFVGSPIRLSQDADTMANAAAFGDIDEDGRLDIVIGNWTQGYRVMGGTPKASADRVLIAQGDMRYRASALGGPPGYTLTTLLTDFTGDGHLDLVDGNDFGPDDFYVGGGDGSFRRLLRSDGMIPGTGLNSMTVTAADIDNDLRQELFIAQIAHGSSRGAMLARRRAPLDVVAAIARPQDREAPQRAAQMWPVIESIRATEDIGAVARIDDPWMRQQFACFAASLWAMRRISADRAGLIPSHCGLSEFLARAFSDRYKPTEDEKARRIPIAPNTANNLLLKADADGRFVDRAEALNVAVTDWTWNARFADVDNDGWQDLYAATGWLQNERWESNVYLHNINGTAYRNETARAGLEDYLPTSSYTYADLDLDGDLDIVSVPVLGPVRVFLNNARGTHALQIELRDLVGNSHGIGSRIVVHYGTSGELHQLRELQASGGFGSYDAPVAHFGLGSHQAVRRIDVLWSTGETTTIAGPFEAGHRYVIHRDRPQNPR